MKESFDNKPSSIQEAISSGNRQHLKNAGRKGGQRTADQRALEKVLQAEAEAQELADAIAHEEVMLAGDDMAEDREALT